MELPTTVTYRHVEKTEELDQMIHSKATKLQQFCPHLQSCRIAVEKQQEHQRSGRPFRLRIDMTVPPGHELVVSKESSSGDIHQDMVKTINEAFEAASRQLKELNHRQNQKTKSHPTNLSNGVVDKLFANENYGFIKTVDGRDLYFHRNSVLNHDFDRLEIGTAVRYVEESGNDGPQASTVQIEDKRPHSRIV